MRGGKREGSGRPKGAKSEKTKQREAIRDTALADGVTPLEVMLQAMRAHYSGGRLDEAADKARDAAPYVHPKLANIAHGGDEDNPVIVENRVSWQSEQKSGG